MFANPTIQPPIGEEQPSLLDTEHKDDALSSEDEVIEEDERMQDEEEEVIAVPKDEKEQQLVIESMEETKHEDSIMRTDLHQKE